MESNLYPLIQYLCARDIEIFACPFICMSCDKRFISFLIPYSFVPWFYFKMFCLKTSTNPQFINLIIFILKNIYIF